MSLFRLFMLWLTFLAVQGIKLITNQMHVPRTWIGAPAEREQFPWQVQLIRRVKHHTGEIHWISFCGGVLIAQNVVLTAAHCLVPEDKTTFMNKVFCQPKSVADHEDLNRNIRVVTGHHYTDHIPTRSDEDPQWSRILDHRYPENYDYPSNDVCLIKTIWFEISELVNDIPIAEMDIDYGHVTCIIAGYGYENYHLKEDPMETETLIWDLVKLLPKRECDKRLEGETQEIICIGGRGTAKVAKGNSGSPLICHGTGDRREHERKGIVVGIVLGTTKDEKTTVFTRLSAHKQFLSETLSAAQKMSSPKYCIFIGFAIISFN